VAQASGLSAARLKPRATLENVKQKGS
jgi:hypothetical protein